MFALLVVRAAALFGMFGKGTALNALKARRSVVKYSDKAVPASATTRALEAAIQAPNHFLSEPWRFYTAGPETKAKLCGLNEEKRKAAEGVPESPPPPTVRLPLPGSRRRMLLGSLGRSRSHGQQGLRRPHVSST